MATQIINHENGTYSLADTASGTSSGPYTHEEVLHAIDLRIAFTVGKMRAHVDSMNESLDRTLASLERPAAEVAS